MKLSPGDYIVWNGHATNNGKFSFWRPDWTGESALILQSRSEPHVSVDADYAKFLTAQEDFATLAEIIAETHYLRAKSVTLRGCPAYQFVSMFPL